MNLKKKTEGNVYIQTFFWEENILLGTPKTIVEEIVRLPYYSIDTGILFI